MVVTSLAVALSFVVEVHVHDGGVLEVVGYDTLLPHGLEDVHQFLSEGRSPNLYSSAGFASGTDDFH